MGALGIECEKERSDQGVWNHGKGFYDAGAGCFSYGVLPLMVGASGVWSGISVRRERKTSEGVYTSEKASYNLASLLIAELPERAGVL
jgi:hypothetical protein